MAVTWYKQDQVVRGSSMKNWTGFRGKGKVPVCKIQLLVLSVVIFKFIFEFPTSRFLLTKATCVYSFPDLDIPSNFSNEDATL